MSGSIWTRAGAAVLATGSLALVVFFVLGLEWSESAQVQSEMGLLCLGILLAAVCGLILRAGQRGEKESERHVRTWWCLYSSVLAALVFFVIAPLIEGRWRDAWTLAALSLLLATTPWGVGVAATTLYRATLGVRAARNQASGRWPWQRVKAAGASDQRAPEVQDSLEETVSPSRESETRPTPTDPHAADRWRWDRGYHVPRNDTDPDTDLALCLSGGGIRSASVALGALQVLQEQEVLSRARYLFSVSGGAYIAGALQLAATRASAEATKQDRGSSTGTRRVTDSPADGLDVSAPFGAGSPEEDFLRCRSSYMADTPQEWLQALGVLLRGLLANVLILVSLAVVSGFVLQRFYILAAPRSREWNPEAGVTDRSSAFPADSFVEPGLLVVGVTALFSIFFLVLGYTLGGGQGSQSTRLRLRLLGTYLGVCALLFATTMVAVPTFLSVVDNLRPTTEKGGVAAATGGGGAAVGVAYLGILAGILWRSRKTVVRYGKGAFDFLKPGQPAGIVQNLPSSVLQRVIVWTGLVAIVAGLLVVLAVSTTLPWWWAGVACFVLVVAVLLDQTWISLHPFYRRRLAFAFAVRRRQEARERDAAVGYPESEMTWLSSYGRRVEPLPQMIFCAAAHVSGNTLAPPGRRVVSYTLSHDWIGGPDVGFLRTSSVDDLPGHVSRDVTVQAAMAISGAAISSAMGTQSRGFQTFFSLSNARLGTWLPNPAYVAEHLSDGVDELDWRVAPLPRTRRLTYLLREILGTYSPRGRLLFVSDGGHYENLGLVEALRHRCKTIYVVDASGDVPPLAGTVADAMSLAKEELGVDIDLKEPLHVVPGSGGLKTKLAALSDLDGRLSLSTVIVGEITYPRTARFPRPSRGLLVISKVSLTGTMHYELLSYALRHRAFPRDSTADQWFDAGQFAAYRQLGREMATEALTSTDIRERGAGRPRPLPAAERLPAPSPAL